MSWPPTDLTAETALFVRTYASHAPLAEVCSTRAGSAPRSERINSLLGAAGQGQRLGCWAEVATYLLGGLPCDLGGYALTGRGNVLPAEPAAGFSDGHPLGLGGI
jgi:hypothetical protein